MKQLSVRNGSDMWEDIAPHTPSYFPHIRAISDMSIHIRMLIKDRRSEDFSAVKGSDLDEDYLEEVLW